MILDNGEQVFLWLGSRCSEVEIKLAYKSAQVNQNNTVSRSSNTTTRARAFMFLGVHSTSASEATGQTAQIVLDRERKRIS